MKDETLKGAAGEDDGPRSEPSSPAPTLSDAETRALIEEARSYARNAPRWKSIDNQEAETAAVLLIRRLADALEAASRSESTDARRVATPGFAEQVTITIHRNHLPMIRDVAKSLKDGGAVPSTRRRHDLQNMWRAIFYRFDDEMREAARTAEKRAETLTGATGEPVTARAETDDQEAEVTHERK